MIARAVIATSFVVALGALVTMSLGLSLVRVRASSYDSGPASQSVLPLAFLMGRRRENRSGMLDFCSGFSFVV